MSRKLYELSRDEKIKLEALADEGASLSRAAEALNLDRRTLIKAADRAGLADWLAEKFPPKRPFQPPKKAPDHLNRRSANPAQQTLALRALTRSWNTKTSHS